jgi:hypothetical protein
MRYVVKTYWRLMLPAKGQNTTFTLYRLLAEFDGLIIKLVCRNAM